MGYFKDMYGTRNADFVNGFMSGLMARDDCADLLIDKLLEDAVNEMAENPEDFNIDAILARGFV